MLAFSLDVWPRTYQAEKSRGGDLETCSKQQNRVAGIQWAAFRQDASYTGHLPDGLGCFAYQLEGQRLVAMASVSELCDIVKPDMSKTLTTADKNAPADDYMLALQDYI